MKAREGKGFKVFSAAILLLMLVITLLPLLLMVMNSFKTRIQITTNPLALPEALNFDNYRNAWVQGSIARSSINSISLVIGTLVITLLVSCMAAYGLARKAVFGWKTISVYFLVCNTLPKQLFIIPLFFILQKAGLVNNLAAMMVIYSAIYTPFAIFLLKTYFEAIDQDIMNSAMIDGASNMQVFWRIVIPLVQPGLLTAALIVGLWCWNEFLFSVTFLQNEEVTTLAVQFYSFTSRYTTEWGNMMAYAVLVTLPVIVFFVFLQRKFIDGMTAGGVKG